MCVSLCVFISRVSAFCTRCIVCCSIAWLCFVLLRLNVLLTSMCASVVIDCVCFLSGVFV